MYVWIRLSLDSMIEIQEFLQRKILKYFCNQSFLLTNIVFDCEVLQLTGVTHGTLLSETQLKLLPSLWRQLFQEK